MIICYRTISNGDCPLRASKTPRAALGIPACGVGHPRVRRWTSPCAALDIPLCIVKSLREATAL